MPNRRDFMRNAAGATATLLMSGHPFVDAASRQVGAPPGGGQGLIMASWTSAAREFAQCVRCTTPFVVFHSFHGL